MKMALFVLLWVFHDIRNALIDLFTGRSFKGR